MPQKTLVPFQIPVAQDSTKASLERIKKQLTPSGSFLLQGPLLKRSETLRKWNQRWFTLDPTTGKLEYRIERGDIAPKGLITFDGSSSIIVSPLNLQGSIKYNGCCIYIQTSNKTEYFLCAETPGAAQAWVTTLRAAQLVLKAHKEAVTCLGGNGSSAIGTIAAVVAAANATAKEAAKEVAAALQSSTVAASKSGNLEAIDGFMDNLSIMKETLKVKDEELRQMTKDLRARDVTIKELAEQLSDTAEAAEAAASAAHIMDKERKAVRSEIVKLRKELDEKLQLSSQELQTMKKQLSAAEKARDEAMKETLLWRGELAKAGEHALIMEAALARAEETAKQAFAAADIKARDSIHWAAATVLREDARAVPESVSPSQVYNCNGEETEFKVPVVAAHSMPHGIDEHLSDVALGSMHNNIKDLLLDLEVEERKASFEKEKTEVPVDASAIDYDVLESNTDKADVTPDDEPQLHT
eukprot:c20875_g2_i1 orf=119-1528(+)